MHDSSRNPVRLAIIAAGGNRQVAALFGVSKTTVTLWWRKLSISSRLVGKLCDAGGGLVPAETVRAYVADNRAATAARQARERFARPSEAVREA